MDLYNQNLGDPGKMPWGLLAIFIFCLALLVGAVTLVMLKYSKKPVAKRIPDYAVPAAYAAIFLCLPIVILTLTVMLFPCWWQGC